MTRMYSGVAAVTQLHMPSRHASGVMWCVGTVHVCGSHQVCVVVLCCVVCILYIMYIHMCSVCPSHVQHSHIQSTYNITVINLPHTVHANRLQSLHV